jgi:hypothetical protein
LLGLSFHGLRVWVDGDWPEVVDDLREDFAWFVAEDASAEDASAEDASAEDAGADDVRVTIQRSAPDFDALGDLTASFVTPRNVVYQLGDRAVIDYFGQAASVYDRSAQHLLVQGLGRDLVHEAAYLFVLSRVGERLDAIGLPRLHALGLSGGQGAVAVMLPSGGGKSTLAVSALLADGVKLLSEDSPLVDAQGTLYPFPLRLGVNASDAARLPPGRLRTVERMEFHPKTLLEMAAIADRVEPAPQPLRHLVLGQRTLSRRASLCAISRRHLAGPLLRECVVGVGLYQGMEFVLQRGLRDVAGKTGPALTRLRCCAAVLSRAQTWRLELGRDHEANWAALQPLLR